MKSLYESLLTGKVPKPRAKVRPSSRNELEQIIDAHIKQIKPRPGQEVDLNWIDISGVNDLRELFEYTNYIPIIDTWKIDHVKDFSRMFAHNEYIVYSPIPVLQKKLLRDRCYAAMFLGCSSLKVTPELPAVNLTKECYLRIFADCISLEEPPVLPATELAEECYAAMFQNCIALKVAPELPATELAPYCYWYMFQNCTALKVAPELPATKLTPYCYSSMFRGCSSLVKPPVLPAKKLARACYWYMFMSCTALEERAETPKNAHTDYYDYARDMYKGCPCESKLFA